MDVLIAAFRKAFPAGDEAVTLTIAGDGPERDRLADLVAGDARIRMLGYVEDVRPLYRAAHVYVSSARIEPFGLTILEAMQAGCQLICSRTEGPSEFLALQDPTWVDIEDIDALADALRRAAAPPVPSKTWDMRAFAPATAAEKIEAFYKACIADLAQR
jgi:glycosyltransferase involved in cell wall biosynthesis